MGIITFYYYFHIIQHYCLTDCSVRLTGLTFWNGILFFIYMQQQQKSPYSHGIWTRISYNISSIIIWIIFGMANKIVTFPTSTEYGRRSSHICVNIHKHILYTISVWICIKFHHNDKKKRQSLDPKLNWSLQGNEKRNCFIPHLLEMSLQSTKKDISSFYYMLFVCVENSFFFISLHNFAIKRYLVPSNNVCSEFCVYEICFS